MTMTMSKGETLSDGTGSSSKSGSIVVWKRAICVVMCLFVFVGIHSCSNVSSPTHVAVKDCPFHQFFQQIVNQVTLPFREEEEEKEEENKEEEEKETAKVDQNDSQHDEAKQGHGSLRKNKNKKISEDDDELNLLETLAAQDYKKAGDLHFANNAAETLPPKPILAGQQQSNHPRHSQYRHSNANPDTNVGIHHNHKEENDNNNNNKDLEKKVSKGHELLPKAKNTIHDQDGTVATEEEEAEETLHGNDQDEMDDLLERLAGQGYKKAGDLRPIGSSSTLGSTTTTTKHHPHSSGPRHSQYRHGGSGTVHHFQKEEGYVPGHYHPHNHFHQHEHKSKDNENIASTSDSSFDKPPKHSLRSHQGTTKKAKDDRGDDVREWTYKKAGDMRYHSDIAAPNHDHSSSTSSSGMDRPRNWGADQKVHQYFRSYKTNWNEFPNDWNEGFVGMEQKQQQEGGKEDSEEMLPLLEEEEEEKQEEEPAAL